MNLTEILKGHEGETFYSPLYGSVILDRINNDNYPIIIKNLFDTRHALTKEGKYCLDCNDNECMLFPSRDQRDWNKWAEEQKPEIPKTWDELCLLAQVEQTEVATRITFDDNDKMIDMSYAVGSNKKLVKSALALLKIQQLIEKGHGGNITKKEWDNEFIEVWYISKIGDRYIVSSSTSPFYLHLAFHTKKQAEEFLSYPENVQLLNDFYRYD